MKFNFRNSNYYILGNESGTIYNDEDESSQNNGSAQDSFWNPTTGDCIANLLSLIAASTFIIVFII